MPRRGSDLSSIRTDGEHGRIHRLLKRANTVVHYQNDVEDPRPSTHFQHGAEPGIDTQKDPEPEIPTLGKTCQTTLVDFSEDKIEKHEFDNDELLGFLDKPREDWVKCRWINVNGLSWTVIKALGNKYKLHRLAVEDLLNTRGRAKIDWYPDNVYSKQFDLLEGNHDLC
jgi:Mg2+ and Co2+ transporter CorA